MKKTIAMLLVLCLLCAGAALAEAEAVSETPQPGEGVSNILVAYFSCTGNTRPLAEYVAESTGADLYEIIPAAPYTDEDLDYGDDNSRTSIEMNDPDARPAIAEPESEEDALTDLGQYDIIFLGYPIWWGEAPRIISTFLESYDFSGKTVVPFCTSGGSGIGSSAENLHALTGEETTWLEGARFAAGTSREEMTEWVNGLGLGIAVE